MTTGHNNILNRLKMARGIDFSSYRPSVIGRRINARLAKLGIDDPHQYLDLLENDPHECDRLIETIAINVSCFFRDPIVFEIMAQKILPEIIEAKRQSKKQELRIWSAGCAAGEEAFSLAILALEALRKDDSQWSIYIFGTDIDQKVLQRAAKGIYPRESMQHTKLSLLDRYFNTTAYGFEVNSSVRKMVDFSNDDLTSTKTLAPIASVYGEFDIILCRNVLIYFNLDLQNLVLGKFLRALVPGGTLVLGDAETISAEQSNRFRVIDSRNKIYQSLN